MKGSEKGYLVVVLGIDLEMALGNCCLKGRESLMVLGWAKYFGDPDQRHCRCPPVHMLPKVARGE